MGAAPPLEEAQGGALLQELPPEGARATTLVADRFRQASFHAFDVLDAASLCQLRRIAKLDDCWQGEAAVAVLRARALQSLLDTKFPFTHAAYVLGLNGQHYSFDTNADRHYGIPSRLPRLLCRIFRMAFPGVTFTTVRIQKFSASLNFGGQHRTLTFSLGHPVLAAPAKALALIPKTDEDLDKHALQEADSDEPSSPSAPERRGFVLLMSDGCRGGRGELCEDVLGEPSGHWRPLAGPATCAGRQRWVPFPVQSWLRWYWPQAGQYFVITVTCERQDSCAQLRQRERAAMEALGFFLPALLLQQSGAPGGGSDADSCDGSATPPAPVDERPEMPQFGRIQAALRLLRFERSGGMPEARALEERFRCAALRAHPDRQAAGAGEQPVADGTWNMSQLLWARRILRQAIAAEAAQRAASESAAGRGEAGAAAPATIAPPQFPAIQDAAADDAGAEQNLPALEAP